MPQPIWQPPFRHAEAPGLVPQWTSPTASVWQPPFRHAEAPGLVPQWTSPTASVAGIQRRNFLATHFIVGGMNISIDEARNTITSIGVRMDDIVDHRGGRFDFVPSPSTFHGSHQLGDVMMRVRRTSERSYVRLSTSTAPAAAKPLPRPPPAGELAAANITGTLSTTLPLTLTRHYTAAADGHGLEMRFVFTNTGGEGLEIGSWGAAMIFETMDTQGSGRRTLDDLAGNCSMVDPAIIGAHGWVSVTRMTGTGPVLLVVPGGGGGLQAWRPMPEASGGRFHEAMSLSKAYADDEWKAARGEQWLAPTAASVAAGDSLVFSYRLLLSPSVREKEATLGKAGYAVLQAVPAYTIGTDMRNATLHVLPPANASIEHVTAQPAGHLSLSSPRAVGGRGTMSVGVRGLTPGRVRLSVSFSDGTVSSASYHVLPPFDVQLSRYGAFASQVAWYDNTSDPFGRAPCALGYNRELRRRIGVGAWDGGYEDNRIFNNGLSDEAGAGAHVGFAAKVSGAPVAAEVAKLDAYVTQTLYGVQSGLPFGASLQCVEGSAAAEEPSCGPPSLVGPTADGIMASMFWVPVGWPTTPGQDKMPGYDYNASWFCDAAPPPTKCPAGWPGWRWDQARAASLGRAYNYPHQSSVYLAMYLVAASYQRLQTAHPPSWYLRRAYKTVVAMYTQASWYAHQGLMDGTNFRTILRALRAEGWHNEAATVEGIMLNRTVAGVENGCRYYVPPGQPTGDRGPAYPGCHWYLASNRSTPWAEQTGLPGAGSEFAWDTTGQEEAYIWGAYFGERGHTNAAKLATSALDQILAYTPLVPNWAWHGSAYGVGDFGNNGYYRTSERVLQHYRCNGPRTEPGAFATVPCPPLYSDGFPLLSCVHQRDSTPSRPRRPSFARPRTPTCSASPLAPSVASWRTSTRRVPTAWASTPTRPISSTTPPAATAVWGSMGIHTLPPPSSYTTSTSASSATSATSLCAIARTARGAAAATTAAAAAAA